MITKKEDLINTKVDGRNDDLCRLFQEAAFSFGFTWCGFNDQEIRYPDDDYFVICCDETEISWEREEFSIHAGYKQLTLSDLKPRTRTEYEKVTESNFDVWDLKLLLENGELFSRTSKGDYLLYSANAPTYMLMHFNEYGVYRKVEKPIEWWEDAAEFVKSFGHAENVELHGELLVEASMTRDQWCDFARILLEQEGE